MLLKPVTFFGGKGGVGKTTLAAAAAWKAAQRYSTLLVSTDPAHNLGHLWDVSLNDAPKAVADRLDVVEIDPGEVTEKHLTEVRSTMQKMMPQRLHSQVDHHLDLARQSPGTHESALLERMADLVDSGYERIIFDTAPSGHTARLVELPEIMQAWTDGLLERRDRSDRFTSLVRGLGGDTDKVDKRNQEIRSILWRRRERFVRLRETLQQDSEFYLVLTPERLPVLETKQFYSQLRNSGMTIGGVIVNRRSPKGQGSFMDARRRVEDEALKSLGLPTVEVPLLPADVGPEQLGFIAELL
ncbi:ArsA family ATPase [Corynebacterium confusum]